MNWKIYKKSYNKVRDEQPSMFSDREETNVVLDESWCEDYSFCNEFNSPEEAYNAFKELCKENHNKQYATKYTDMEMVCLPTFTICSFNLKD